MRKLKHRIIALATVMAMGIGGVGFISPTQHGTTATIEAKAAESTGLNVDYHSQQEIAAYMNAHSSAMNFTTAYAAQPCAKQTYLMGELSQSTQNSAVELLNIIRYVAGIPYNVTIDSEYSKYAQAGALVNASNNELSHFPSQPSGMSTDLYNLGYTGTSSSNLAMGYTLCAAIKNGWMSDGDSYNIQMVGHRRWCLNPTMSKTGFGEVKSATTNYKYTSMYAFDRSNTAGSAYSRVAWPAQNTPDCLFSSQDPWSISMGTAVNASTVQVTLKCVNSGKTYYFNSTSSDGYFNVNNDGYGQKGCIIFRPSNGTLCTAGYTYSVSITGKYSSGESFNVNYNVNFFNVATSSTSNNTNSGQWMKSNGRWWYRNADGSYPTGWAMINSKWYLFDNSGWMLTNWQKTSGKWYYLGSDGAMRTGWQKVNGKWYYLESSGAMATGWKKVNGTWYYLESSGAMATGWKKLGGTWYYLESSGAMVTDWKQINGTWYYFKSSGAMATGTVKIGSKNYKFSSSGAWIR